jgi:hypothetical protein
VIGKGFLEFIFQKIYKIQGRVFLRHLEKKLKALLGVLEAFLYLQLSINLNSKKTKPLRNSS